MNGRFFGIEKTDGSQINAKLVSETNNYITVSDRNQSFDYKKMAKTSIKALTIAGETIR